MVEKGSYARPYALAAFKQAREEGRVAEWAQMLELLAGVVADREVGRLIENPRIEEEQLGDAVIEACGDALSETGRNFVRVLAHNRRLDLLGHIAEQFARERDRLEGRSRVVVESAYELDPETERTIAEKVARRLGTEVELTVEVDPSLIGGAVIRAGDVVIDASLRGRLQQLTRALG